MHHVERIPAKRAAAVGTEGHVQRPHVNAGADDSLDELPLVDVSRNEVRQDAVLPEPLEVLDVEGGRRVHHHAGPRRLHLRDLPGASP